MTYRFADDVEITSGLTVGGETIASILARIAVLEAQRPVFALWAEENGGIANSSYEWSWGNGATGNDIGVPVAVACELFAVSFNADIPGTSVTMRTLRNVSTVYTSNHVGQNSVDTLPTPVPFSVGDLVGFQTGTLVGTWTDARVCAWFRET